MAKRKQPRRRQKAAERYPGKPAGPGGHYSFPVRGCACMQCAAHREGERAARWAHEMGKRARSETMGPSELLAALGHDV